MAINKAQVLRNILRQLKENGGGIDLDIRTIDSMDEKKLLDFCNNNIYFQAIHEDRSRGNYLMPFSIDSFLAELDKHNTEKELAKVLDGAIFGTVKNEKGIRLEAANGDVKIIPVDNTFSVVDLTDDVQQLQHEIEVASKKLADATEYLNKTPEPKKPGFFAKLFNWQPNKDYNAYMDAKDMAEEAEAALMEKTAELKSKMAALYGTDPNSLNDKESLFKEKAVEVQKEVQPEVVSQPDPVKEVEINKQPEPQKEAAPIKNSEQESQIITDEEPEEPELGEVERIRKSAVDQLFDEKSTNEFVKQINIHGQLFGDNFANLTGKELAPNANIFERGLNAAASNHQKYMSQLKSYKAFPERLTSRAVNSANTIYQASLKALNYRINGGEKPVADRSLLNAVSVRMMLKCMANERVAFNEDGQIFGPERNVGQLEQSCKDPAELNKWISYYSSLSSVQEIAQKIAEDPEFAHDYMSNPDRFFGFEEFAYNEIGDLQNEQKLRDIDEKYDRELKEELEKFNKQLKEEEEARKRQEDIKAGKKDISGSKPISQEDIKIAATQSAASKYGEEIGQLSKIYGGQLFFVKLAGDAEKCINQQIESIKTGQPVKDPEAFTRFAAESMLFEQIRDEYILLNGGEKTNNFAQMGALQSHSRFQKDFDEAINSYMELPIVKQMGEKLSNDSIEFMSFVGDRQNMIMPAKAQLIKEYSEMQKAKYPGKRYSEGELKEIENRIKEAMEKDKKYQQELAKQKEQKNLSESKKLEEINRQLHGGLLAVGPKNDRRFFDENMKEVPKQELTRRMEKTGLYGTDYQLSKIKGDNKVANGNNGPGLGK